MVKFVVRKASKKYTDKNEKERKYEYKQIGLPIPKKFHKIIEPFLKQDLVAKIKAKNGTIFIDLTPKKIIRT